MMGPGIKAGQPDSPRQTLGWEQPRGEQGCRTQPAPALPLSPGTGGGGIAPMGSPVRRNGIFYLVLQQLRGLCVLVAFCPPPSALAGVFTRVWVSPSLSVCAPALPSCRQPPCEQEPSVPIPQHTLLPFSSICATGTTNPQAGEALGGWGDQQEAHTDPPAVVPGCCRLCPCPLEPFCAPQAGQIGSACSQEGWHGTRGELQDVPLRGANGAGKRQGSGAVAVPRWQPLGLEVWVAQSGWGLSEAS